jgi:hypothetical protein
MVAMFDDKYALWLDAMDRVETALKPICAKAQTIATLEEWQKQPDPLEAAGVKELAVSTLLDMATSYEFASADQRAAMREAFLTFPLFAWTARLPADVLDGTALRRLLALFSLRDLGRDSRDAILELAELCNAAQRAGVDPVPLLKEAALLSSDVDKHGLGSTKDILLRQVTALQGGTM